MKMAKVTHALRRASVSLRFRFFFLLSSFKNRDPLPEIKFKKKEKRLAAHARGTGPCYYTAIRPTHRSLPYFFFLFIRQRYRVPMKTHERHSKQKKKRGVGGIIRIEPPPWKKKKWGKEFDHHPFLTFFAEHSLSPIAPPPPWKKKKMYTPRISRSSLRHLRRPPPPFKDARASKKRFLVFFSFFDGVTPPLTLAQPCAPPCNRHRSKKRERESESQNRKKAWQVWISKRSKENTREKRGERICLYVSYIYVNTFK